MKRCIAILAGCVWIGCSGPGAVRDTKSAGTMSVVTRRPAKQVDHEAVIVTATSQQDSRKRCAPVPVFFDKGSAQLDDLAKVKLNQQLDECLKARVLEVEDGVAIEVEVHEDPRFGAKLEEELVAERVGAVLQHLQEEGFDTGKYQVKTGD